MIVIVGKYTTPGNDTFHDLSYYVARIQRRKRYVKLRWFDQHFPDHEVIMEIDNPNSTVRLIDLKKKDIQSKNATTLG